MKNWILSWCKNMFMQTDGAIRVRTASCQGGALCAWRKAAADIEVVSSFHPLGEPLVRLQEHTIYLNRTESSFVSREVRRLLKTQTKEVQRRRQAHIPLPPTPGKIAYAVYQ